MPDGQERKTKERGVVEGKTAALVAIVGADAWKKWRGDAAVVARVWVRQGR